MKTSIATLIGSLAIVDAFSFQPASTRVRESLAMRLQDRGEEMFLSSEGNHMERAKVGLTTTPSLCFSSTNDLRLFLLVNRNAQRSLESAASKSSISCKKVGKQMFLSSVTMS